MWSVHRNKLPKVNWSMASEALLSTILHHKHFHFPLIWHWNLEIYLKVFGKEEKGGSSDYLVLVCLETSQGVLCHLQNILHFSRMHVWINGRSFAVFNPLED